MESGTNFVVHIRPSSPIRGEDIKNSKNTGLSFEVLLHWEQQHTQSKGPEGSGGLPSIRRREEGKTGEDVGGREQGIRKQRVQGHRERERQK